MRHRLYGGSLFATCALVVAGLAGRAGAQPASTYAVPGRPAENVPIPTGNPGTHGFYTFAEFMFLTQTWGLGDDQVVAYRGLVDSRGAITGLPGTYIGSGQVALSTNDFARRSWQPGFNVGIGYKLDDGTSIYLSYLSLLDRNYHAGATLATPFFRSRFDLSDTFLVAGVFNFPPQYAGPLVKTEADDTNGNNDIDDNEGGNFYGIWNGASVMDIQFNQWFTQWEVGARVPLLQTEYSRIYGLAGGRFDWFMERFLWRTVSYDILGRAGPQDAARYNNTLSQRMYGPFLGCGHEVYVGKRFSMSLDLTGALLMNIIKERAKYKLESGTIQNKLSRDEFGVVPSATANLNLWWYPIEGVQIRAGYNAWTFFNTMHMHHPIGFNYGGIDPAYETKAFRIVHGVNVGLGLFF
jgi:hypothetical protein